jgi:hypothetical protein
MITMKDLFEHLDTLLLHYASGEVPLNTTARRIGCLIYDARLIGYREGVNDALEGSERILREDEEE